MVIDSGLVIKSFSEEVKPVQTFLMAPSSWLVLLLQLLSCMSAGLACFCDRYPWGSWSACSSTCNHGTQHRVRWDTLIWVRHLDMGETAHTCVRHNRDAAQGTQVGHGRDTAAQTDETRWTRVRLHRHGNSDFPTFLTGIFSTMNITGRAAANRCVRDKTVEAVTSTSVQSTACWQSSGPGLTARPAPRNRQETHKSNWSVPSHRSYFHAASHSQQVFSM